MINLRQKYLNLSLILFTLPSQDEHTKRFSIEEEIKEEKIENAELNWINK